MMDLLNKMGSPLPNYDEKTGIFYGVIAQNSLSGEAVDDILFGSSTRDLSYEEAEKEIKEQINNSLESLTDLYNLCVDIVGKHSLKYSWEKDNLRKIREVLNLYKDKEPKEDIEAILLDEWNNRYDCDSPEFLYEADGYKIIRCLDFDLMILKSPYYCYAPRCSPCVPCAGDLDSIREDWEYNKKTYCLDESFFDEENKPKYKIYEVK